MLEELTGMFGKSMPFNVIATKGSILMSNPILLIIVILISIFWIWMLVECLRKNFKNSMDKLVWVIVLLFTNILGAILYYFLVKKK